MSNNIITLTTDWGLNDPYVAIFKALIFKEKQNLKIIDITHNVSPNNIIEAAYMLRAAYPFFPKNSVHIVDVSLLKDITVREMRKKGAFLQYLAFKYDGHYFLCENNAIISLICKNIYDIETIVSIPQNVEYEQYTSFPALIYYIHSAAKLAQNIDIQSIGTPFPIEEIEIGMPRKPLVEGDKITFYCQHVDTYGNIITNLDKQLFEKVANGRKSFSFYNSALGCIEKCSLLDTYTYTTSSNYIFIFSQSGFLEIARKYTPLAYFLNLDNKKFKDWQFIITFL